MPLYKGRRTSAVRPEGSEGVFGLEKEDFGVFNSLNLGFNLVAILGWKIVEFELVFLRHFVERGERAGSGKNWQFLAGLLRSR